MVSGKSQSLEESSRKTFRFWWKLSRGFGENKFLKSRIEKRSLKKRSFKTKNWEKIFRIFLKFPLSRIVPKNVKKGPFRIL